MNLYEWKNKRSDELAEQFTKYLSKIWRVHPFRDGNTRFYLSELSSEIIFCRLLIWFFTPFSIDALNIACKCSGSG